MAPYWSPLSWFIDWPTVFIKIKDIPIKIRPLNNSWPEDVLEGYLLVLWADILGITITNDKIAKEAKEK